VEKAKRGEPLRSVKLSGNEKKMALVEASKAAREGLLEKLEKVLSPLKGGKAEEQEKAVEEAEKLWEEYLEGEKDRLLAYNQDKARTAMEKEQERKLAALRGEGEEAGGEDGGKTKYLSAKRKIEKALKAEGASVTPGEEAEGAGAKSWKEVTGTRIKGVTDSQRYKYQRERERREEEMGKSVKDFDVEDAVGKVERFEVRLAFSSLLAVSFIC
jgi:hypothetical protein